MGTTVQRSYLPPPRITSSTTCRPPTDWESNNPLIHCHNPATGNIPIPFDFVRGRDDRETMLSNVKEAQVVKLRHCESYGNTPRRRGARCGSAGWLSLVYFYPGTSVGSLRGACGTLELPGTFNKQFCWVYRNTVIGISVTNYRWQVLTSKVFILLLIRVLSNTLQCLSKETNTGQSNRKEDRRLII